MVAVDPKTVQENLARLESDGFILIPKALRRQRRETEKPYQMGGGLRVHAHGG